jgi:hypothetical protein
MIAWLKLTETRRNAGDRRSLHLGMRRGSLLEFHGPRKRAPVASARDFLPVRPKPRAAGAPPAALPFSGGLPVVPKPGIASAAEQLAEKCALGPSGVKPPKENADFMSCLKARPTKLRSFSAACGAGFKELRFGRAQARPSDESRNSARAATKLRISSTENGAPFDGLD